jgi:hypothetical protein
MTKSVRESILWTPAPRAKRNSERFRSGINPCWWCKADSRAQLTTLDDEEQAAKIVRGLWTFFLFLSVYFVLQLTSSFAKCCRVFLLVFFFPSSLHVIHSVFLHSFLSFFLCRYVLVVVVVTFLSSFLILWQLSGTYAIVGSLYLIFFAFPFLWNWRYK